MSTRRQVLAGGTAAVGAALWADTPARAASPDNPTGALVDLTKPTVPFPHVW